MTHNDLLTAVYTKLAGTSGLPSIAYPNRPFNKDTLTEYIKVFVLPAPTESITIDGCEYQYGIIQVSCFVRDDVGEIAAAKIAEKIIALFKVGTVITTGLTINKPAYASTGINDGSGWYMMPITARYQAYAV